MTARNAVSRLGALAGKRERRAEPGVDQIGVLAALLQRGAIELGRLGILAIAVKGVADAQRRAAIASGQRRGRARRRARRGRSAARCGARR